MIIVGCCRTLQGPEWSEVEMSLWACLAACQKRVGPAALQLAVVAEAVCIKETSATKGP